MDEVHAREFDLDDLADARVGFAFANSPGDVRVV